MRPEGVGLAFIYNNIVRSAAKHIFIALMFIGAFSLYARPVPMPAGHSTVSMIKSQDLTFGGILKGASSGTIVVNPNGTVNYTGGVVSSTRAGISSAHPAQLTFTLFNAHH